MQVTNVLITYIIWYNIIVDATIELVHNFFNGLAEEILIPLLDEILLEKVLQTCKYNFVGVGAARGSRSQITENDFSIFGILFHMAAFVAID